MLFDETALNLIQGFLNWKALLVHEVFWWGMIEDPSYHSQLSPLPIGVKDLRASFKHQYARPFKIENQQYALKKPIGKNYCAKSVENLRNP